MAEVPFLLKNLESRSQNSEFLEYEEYQGDEEYQGLVDGWIFWILAGFLGLFLGGRGRLHRADDDVRVAPFQPRLAFHLSVARKILRKTQQQLLAQIDVRDLAAAELHYCLHAVAFA